MCPELVFLRLQAVLTSSKCPFITRLVAGQTQSSNPPASTSNPKTPGPVPAPRKGGPKGSVLSTTLSMQFMQQVLGMLLVAGACTRARRSGSRRRISYRFFRSRLEGAACFGRTWFVQSPTQNYKNEIG